MVDLSHVDVTFPTALVENVEGHELLVKGRSDERMCVFRVTPENRKLTVYPGDTLPLFELDYYVDHSIYHCGDFQEVFAPLATVASVKAFVNGQAPLTAEKPLDELQVF